VSAASAGRQHAASRAAAQRALRGMRGTGVPLMVSLAVTAIATGATVVGLAADVSGVLAVLAFIAAIGLAITRTRMVRPFLRMPAGPLALTPRPGALVTVAVVIWIVTMIAAVGVGGHIGNTRRVSAVVTSCYVDSKGATICSGHWTYGGRTYNGELLGSGPIGSTQTIEVPAAAPGIALPSGSGWLIAGIVLLVVDVGLATGWVLMLRHRSRKIAASAQRALAGALR